MIYISLFVISFLSATLLPLGSEAILLYDISNGGNILLLWIVASIGNTLGSVLNYILGFKGEEYLENKKHLSKPKIDKFKNIFDRYGAFSLILSPLPIIGDPITFIAGVLKYDFKIFLLIVTISKSLRYMILIYLYI